MPVYGSVPAVEHYQAAIWACQQSNQYHLAVSVYTDMKNKGIVALPDIYALLSSVAEATGHYEQAVAYFNNSRSADARNDTLRYNVCMRALAQLDRPLEVLSVFADMETRGVLRDGDSYHHCADAHAELKDGVSALRLLDSMTADHAQPSTAVYNSVMWACIKSGLCSEAMQLFGRMAFLAATPDSDSYTAAIWAAEQCSDADRAVALLRTMNINNLPRSAMAFDGALSALHDADRWSEMLEILRWMSRDGVDKTPISYRLVVGALRRGRQYGDASEVYSEAVRNGYYSPWVPRSRELDLRGFTLPLAQEAIKSVLQSMVDKKLPVFALRVAVGSLDATGFSTTFSVEDFASYLRTFTLHEGDGSGVVPAESRPGLDATICDASGAKWLEISKEAIQAWMGEPAALGL